MAMEIAGHVTEQMHKHYAGGAEPAQKLAAARAAFPNLRVIDGGGEAQDAQLDSIQNRDSNRDRVADEEKGVD